MWRATTVTRVFFELDRTAPSGSQRELGLLTEEVQDSQIGGHTGAARRPDSVLNRRERRETLQLTEVRNHPRPHARRGDVAFHRFHRDKRRNGAVASAITLRRPVRRLAPGAVVVRPVVIVRVSIGLCFLVGTATIKRCPPREGDDEHDCSRYSRKTARLHERD